MPICDPVLTSAGYLLLKAGHFVGEEFDATLASLGLNRREFLMLSYVSASKGLSQQELSARLGIDPTIVVGLVDALEDRGLMTRTRDSADRRRNVLGLTDDGHDLHGRAVETAAAAEDLFLAPLSEAERETLRDLLHEIMRPRLPWLADD
jgi:DNA-binding MarR family transcriptional regulator